MSLERTKSIGQTQWYAIINIERDVWIGPFSILCFVFTLSLIPTCQLSKWK